MAFAKLQNFKEHIGGVKKTITESGKYTGRFIKAEAIVAKKGSKGVEFTFESDDKKSARLKIWIEKQDGTQLYDYDILSAIMVCFGLEEISDPQIVPTTKYDWDLKKEIPCRAPLLLDLSNRPIGVVLQNCESDYGRTDGTTFWELKMRAVYNPETNLTAREIIDKKIEPKILNEIMQSLRDLPIKKTEVFPIEKTQDFSNSKPIELDDIPF